MLYFGSWNREVYTVKNHAFVILGYGCNPRNAWFCTWCGTSVWKLYCKAIFCYRSVIYKRSQITIRSNVWATFQSTHDCRYDIEWLFKNDSHCLRTVCCNFYSSSCTRLCLAILLNRFCPYLNPLMLKSLEKKHKVRFLNSKQVFVFVKVVLTVLP